MNISKNITNAQRLLASTSDSAHLDAELLLCHTLNKPRSFLYAHPEHLLTPAEEIHFQALIEKRQLGMPIAYILGKKEFWTLTFTVTQEVLIPRPETELLIETALELLPIKNAVVADLGTGSGAIACSLAHERPTWQITATDASSRALIIAKENAAHYQLNNIQFYQGHWCEALPHKSFAAILSNPPYIAATDIHLKTGDVRFEPQSALIAEDQGLKDLRLIAEQAQHHLAAQGWLFLEHGYAQSESVQEILKQCGYQNISSKKDLNGYERVTMGQKL